MLSNRRAAIVGAALFLGLTSTEFAAAKLNPPITRLSTHTTILPSAPRQEFFPAADMYWTPTIAEVRRMEATMPKSLTSYYRQYLGIVSGGKRLIYVNGFSSDVAGEFTGGRYDWHTHIVFVDDGGNDFFNATYDPATRHWTGPDYNGLG